MMDDLRTNFSIRYEALPSEAVLANYEDLKRNPNVIAGALLYHPAALYETRRNTLQERGWLVDAPVDMVDWKSPDALARDAGKETHFLLLSCLVHPQFSGF